MQENSSTAKGTSSLPELLCPAGNLEKLKIAFAYGADAVYLAGQKYGLRSAADNFSQDELREATSLAKESKKKIYVVLNSFFHDSDFDGFNDYIKFLDEIDVDAVICSDLGVIETIKERTKLEIHLSTQASAVNRFSAKLWKKLGITRLVVGRELSIIEAGKIREQADVEIEMFVHGAMCMAYSGNCTISNYTSGRDSNRGGCIQSCRYQYQVQGLDKSLQILSSKDLNGLNLILDFQRNKIDSLKIEGRMKSNLYIASVTRAYSNIINSIRNGSSPDFEYWQNELKKLPHRDYTEASLKTKAGSDSVYLQPMEKRRANQCLNWQEQF